MLTRGWKRRMNAADQEEQTPVDMISALPDDILCHILSFLPTKLAFTTTILSKRWTSPCRSLTSLNFYYDSCVDAVNKIFSRVRIKNLVLQYHDEHNRMPYRLLSSKVREWVEVAKQQCVESLEIDVANKGSVLSNIFCFRTLVVLKLSRISVDDGVSSVDLPSLKTLHLSGVNFKNRGDFKKILYGAPIIEDLCVKDVNGEFPYTAGNKTLPKLVRVHLYAWGNLLSPSEIAQMENHIGYSPVFPNLIHIELSFNCFYYWRRILQVLHQCPRLQNLVIKKWEYTGDGYQEKLAYPQLVPECISSHLRTCFIDSDLNDEDDLRFAAYILKSAKFLQAMTMCPYQFSTKLKCPNISENLLFEKLLSLPRISPACEISISKLQAP